MRTIISKEFIDNGDGSFMVNTTFQETETLITYPELLTKQVTDLQTDLVDLNAAKKK